MIFILLFFFMSSCSQAMLMEFEYVSLIKIVGLFFCLPPGSKFGTGLSEKHEINLLWP